MLFDPFNLHLRVLITFFGCTMNCFDASFIFCLILTGMKVYVTDEKELIMEPSVKWAGNPNVTIAVKAFGLKATVQVTLLC